MYNFIDDAACKVTGLPRMTHVWCSGLFKHSHGESSRFWSNHVMLRIAHNLVAWVALHEDHVGKQHLLKIDVGSAKSRKY